MAITAGTVRAAALLLTNEKTRKAIGWVLVAILSPVILTVIIVLSLLSGATQHNNAAVDLVFNGGIIPETMDVVFANHIEDMQKVFSELDNEVARINSMAEDDTEDGAMVKAVFYSLCFGDADRKSPSQIAEFADAFVKYEERIRQVAVGVDEITGEVIYEDEIYTVAVPLEMSEVYFNLIDIGYTVTEETKQNAIAVYERTGHGNSGNYYGEIEYGGEGTTELSISGFTNLETKNAEDLVTYAKNAWQSGWGYVYGCYGEVLTDSLLSYKAEQYPVEVGDSLSIIKNKWMDRRCSDCVGLIKGYGWLNTDTMTIDYNSNGMPDISADGMYNAATDKGSINSMPDIPGIAVWRSGHIGIYIGNGQVIEAMGTGYGVVKTNVAERNWTAWLKIPYISYK